MERPDDPVDAFERAWAAGGEPPPWRDFITENLGHDELTCVLEMDVEQRVARGLPATLTERYWEWEPIGSRLDSGACARLIQNELRHRRRREPLLDSAPFAAVFPELAAAFDDAPKLPGYEVRERIGQGGMGAVYLAEDTRLQRKVALKVMNPDFATNPVARERFVREARAAAKVECDYIVRVYAVGEDRGMPFIAMEYLKGKPMDAWMKESKASIKQILRIGYEAALGLHAAHTAGLIHRDIKPANLWLEAATGRVKILDFGLARPAEEATHLTQSGAVVGTPAYMSPEQGRGKELDHRTDIFSLGCVLYHLATGKRPFTGGNTYEIIASLIADTPTAPHEVNPNVPVELSHAIMRMLEKDAAKRPAKARTVADEMAKMLKESRTPKGIEPLPAAAPTGPPPSGTNADATNEWKNLDETGSRKAEADATEAAEPARPVKLKPPRHSRRCGSSVRRSPRCSWLSPARHC